MAIGFSGKGGDELVSVHGCGREVQECQLLEIHVAFALIIGQIIMLY